MDPVVVIGAGQGGLSAAVHARLAGHDVVVLEQRDVAGGKAASFEAEGFRFDPGPSIVILKEIYEAVFQRAKRPMEDYLRFRRLDPFSRILFEGSSAVDLPADEAGAMDALATLAPGDLGSIKKLLESLDGVVDLIDRTIFARPFEKPWQLMNPDLARFALAFDVRKSYRQMVDEWFKSPVLRAFFYGFPSYSGQTYDSKSAAGLLIPYYMIRRGVWWPEGGIASIPKAFRRLAEDLGVEFRFNCPVQGVRTSGGRVIAVQTPQGEVACRALISNVDRLTFGRWIGRETNVAPSVSYFTLHYGLKKAMPELSHHTLLVPRDFETGFDQLYNSRKFPDPPIVYLNSCVGVEPSAAPPGCTDLFAVVTCPAMEEGLDWALQADEAERLVLRQLDRFGLGFSDAEVAVKKRQAPPTFRDRDGSYRGSLYGPDEPHRLFGGILPLGITDNEFKNLYYVGGSVQPGAGLPMVTLSGKFAADRIR